VREQVPLLAAPITQSLSDISEDRWNLIDVAMLDPIVPAPIAVLPGQALSFLPLPPGEGWAEGIKIIDESVGLIPLIPGFRRGRL